MSFHDPIDPPGASLRDGASPARTAPPADDATHSGDSDPDGATPAAPEPIRDLADIVAGLGSGTIGRMLGEPSDSPTITVPPAGPSPDAALPTVPGYELLEPLGEGGMGIVWKARQMNLNRLVALKMVLGDQRAGSKELIRFLAEAEAVAAVKHPRVVQVYDYGEALGRPFLAMEYLSGGSLTDRLEQAGRLGPKAAADLVATLAGAVQAAHELGIVHRDLKPANVLFDERGQPKVTDFGLAKRAGGGDLTATRAVMGTPAFMAPEQARGETRFVGPQADVYSLGVILYQCLTGTRPFADPDPIALLRKVAEDEPERPGRRAPGLARDVELICLKCLAKDPAERYPTAAALAADLGRFAAGEPVSVRAAGTVERLARWARRKPTLAAAYTLGLLAILLGGLGGVAVWQWRAAERARAEAERLRDRADTARGEAEQGRGREAEARGDAEREREKFERFDYGRMIQEFQQSLLGSDRSNVGALEMLVKDTRPDLHGWEWLYVSRLKNPMYPIGNQVWPARVWTNKENVLVLVPKGIAPAVYSATFSPDGLRVLTANGDGTARVWQAGQSSCNGPREALVLELKGHTAAIYSATFSPDGSRIVTGSADKTARVWDAKSGALVLERKGHTAAVRAATFSPDGSRILTGSEDGPARVWDARSGAPIVSLQGAFVRLATFDPDGSQVLTMSGGGLVAAWDGWTGHKLGDVRCGRASFAMLSSLDGLRVVGDDAFGPTYVWAAFGRVDLGRVLRGTPTSATFSPGGSRVVTGYGDGTTRLWDPQSGAQVLELKGHTKAVTSVTFSPDGSCLLTGSEDGTARIWYGVTNWEWSASSLELVPWGDGSGVPTTGGNVIVGTDRDGLLHMRAFPHGDRIDTFEARDGSGALHFKSVSTPPGRIQVRPDVLESSLLTTQSRAIAALKQRLPRLMPPHVLTGAEKDQVLGAVTSIIGNTRWGL